MKCKKLSLISTIGLTLLLLSGVALADDSKKMDHKKSEAHNQSKHSHAKGEKHDHSDQRASIKKVGKEKIVIKVAGMVCPFCAQGVEKGFRSKKKEVKDVKVDMDTMTVEVLFHKGQSLDEKTLETLITNAGFSYGGIVE